MESRFINYQLYMRKNHNKIIDYSDYNRHKLTRSKTYKRFLYDQSKWKDIK